MPTIKSPMDKSSATTILRAYFLIALLQGVGALFLMLRSTSEAESIFLLGLSRSRFIIATGLLIVLLALGWLLLETWINPKRFDKRLERLTSWMSRRTVWGMTLFLTGSTLIAGFYFITLVPEISEPFTKGLFERLLPLVIWITGMSAQTLLALLLLRFGHDVRKIRPTGKLFYLTIVIVGGFFLIWAWITQNVRPLATSFIGWNPQGAPIIETQVLLAWGAGMAMLAFAAWAANKAGQSPWLQHLKPRRFDLFVGLLLWFGSVVLWQSIPLAPNWFISEPFPPNFEYYPTSDARFYDLVAQTALVGEGFRAGNLPFIRRPLHASLLTVIHTLGGQDYERVVFLQILVLAFLPTLIYFLTKTLHNRVSGVVAAVLIMLREANSIALGGDITASHAKLLMVDLPTTLGVVCFVYFVMLWLKQVEKESLYPMIAGGVLGLSMFIRIETAVFTFPLAIITALILYPKKRFALWIKQMLLFALGIMLIISPWIWRNWKLTGSIFIDSPIFGRSVIAQRYRPIPTLETEPIPTTAYIPEKEGTPEPAQATQPERTLPADQSPIPATDGEEKFARIQPREYVLSNIDQVASFIIAHYWNSQLQPMLTLPTTFRALDSITGFVGHKSPSTLWYECCSLRYYIRRMPYWHKWDGIFPRQAIVPLFVNTLFLAAGIHIAWKRQKIVGLTPLILASTYMLLHAIVRNSGGRYILPVDWTSVLYFTIGLAQLSISFIGYMANANITKKFPLLQETTERSTFSVENLWRSPKVYALSVCLFLLGCTTPVIESSYPKLYSGERMSEMLSTLLQSDLISEEQRSNLQAFTSYDGLVIAGRGLYPRYLPSNVGEPGLGADDILSPQPYSRFIFYIVGPYRSVFSIPLKESPSYFPDASDILVIGCAGRWTMETLVVAIFDPSGHPKTVLMRDPLPTTFTCPLTSPTEDNPTVDN